MDNYEKRDGTMVPETSRISLGRSNGFFLFQQYYAAV